MKENKLFIFCSCYSELLVVEKDNEENEVYFALFNHQNAVRNMNWRERFRWIWQILKTGNIWNDSIIISKEDAKKLSEFLKE